uniref:Uncharacterized protein n=1 Tax=Brassica campestris TaxID=3711 RepID=M4CV13_BRACM
MVGVSDNRGSIDQSNRVVEVKENTRERNEDNLETNLEVGEDEIIQREVELLKKKSDQQDKAIFDLRAQLEALKGQPRDDPQGQYSSPFQPDNETQPQHSSFHQNEEEEDEPQPQNSSFQPGNEQQDSSFHQNGIEEQTRMDGNRCEPTGMNEEEERELQLHGELRSQTQYSPIQPQSSSFQPRDETQPLRKPTGTNEEEELHCELQLHQKPVQAYVRNRKRKQRNGIVDNVLESQLHGELQLHQKQPVAPSTRNLGISSRGCILMRPDFFTAAAYK